MTKEDHSETSAADIWRDDMLGRAEDARLLINFLVARTKERASEGRTGAYVLNLDAGWGNGKTFFLTRLKQQLQHENYLVAYVNAWQDDADGEPMTAVMAQLRATVEPYFSRDQKIAQAWEAALTSGAAIAGSVGKGLLRQAINTTFGNAVNEIPEILENATNNLALEEIAEGSSTNLADRITDVTDKILTERINSYKKRQKSMGLFKCRLSALISSISDDDSKPIFIFLDELDRCRPLYAINMLEDTKHLFDVSGLVFVVATDTEQLAHSVRSIYGEKFNAEGYLLRFFNRRYVFEESTLEDFVNQMYSSHPELVNRLAAPLGTDPVTCFAGLMRHYGLSLRDAEHCFDILRNFVTTWDKPIAVQMVLAVPLIALFHLRRMDDFSKLSDLISIDIKRPQNAYRIKAYDYPRMTSFREYFLDDMIHDLLPKAKIGLSEIDQLTENNSLSKWTKGILVDEYSVIHNSSRILGQEIPSVLSEYGRRIKGVGRIN